MIQIGKLSSGNLRDFPDGVYNESNLEGLINNSYDIPYYYKLYLI